MKEMITIDKNFKYSRFSVLFLTEAAKSNAGISDSLSTNAVNPSIKKFKHTPFFKYRMPSLIVHTIGSYILLVSRFAKDKVINKLNLHRDFSIELYDRKLP